MEQRLAVLGGQKLFRPGVGGSENARNITLPHDAMLEQRAYAESPNGGNTGFRDGGVYTYVKTLNVAEAQKGKLLMLKF
ncbi:MAG: hypothetical protein LUH42_08410, partial [Oscillospiraceae bacterium]|nr:hypothetical protein [Oscillospiraceae bacterium]